MGAAARPHGHWEPGNRGRGDGIGGHHGGEVFDVATDHFDHGDRHVAAGPPLARDLGARRERGGERHTECQHALAHSPIIAVMRLSPLSPRVVALSWGAALILWPLAWLLLAVAQGAGTAMAGGGWIGVAVPFGAHPWGIVNEPNVAFAGSRAALFLYWLAPPLLALAVAVVAPTLLPVPPGWLA
ncbi:MAG: hypothetical protein B7Z68_13555, partial [Acidobacteria bacterium 21-70-11]